MNPPGIMCNANVPIGRKIYRGGLHVAANTVNHPGEPQARRLESVYEQLTKLTVHPDAIRRLRAAGDNEWSVMQVLGHNVRCLGGVYSPCGLRWNSPRAIGQVSERRPQQLLIPHLLMALSIPLGCSRQTPEDAGRSCEDVNRHRNLTQCG